MRARLRPNGKFLTLRQAESEFGIPYSRIWEWIQEGRLPHLDDGRRSYLVRRTDLEIVIERHMTQARV